MRNERAAWAEHEDANRRDEALDEFYSDRPGLYEWAVEAGEHQPHRQWIAGENEMLLNPHYHGPAQPHPSYDSSDDPDPED